MQQTSHLYLDLAEIEELFSMMFFENLATIDDDDGAQLLPM
jgi:hypothetical protein